MSFRTRMGGASVAPASIVAAGPVLVGVWDNRRTAGAHRTTYTKIAAADLTGLPVVYSAAGNSVTISGTVTLTGIDFDGCLIAIINDATVATLNDCLLPGWGAGRNGLMRLWVGQTAGAGPGGSPELIANRCTIDLLNGNPFGGHSLINGFNGSKATFNACRILNAPRGLINWGTATSRPLALNDCYVGALGVLTDATDHIEAIQFLGGVATYTRTFFDMNSANDLPLTGGLTGGLFFEGTAADVVATIDSCIIRGATRWNAASAMQMKANNHNVTVTILNTVCELGTAGSTSLGWCASLNQTGVCTKIDGGGNRSYATGLTSVFS